MPHGAIALDRNVSGFGQTNREMTRPSQFLSGCEYPVFFERGRRQRGNVPKCRRREHEPLVIVIISSNFSIFSWASMHIPFLLSLKCIDQGGLTTDRCEATIRCGLSLIPSGSASMVTGCILVSPYLRRMTMRSFSDRVVVLETCHLMN
jgi:hypothetical protein